MPQPYIGSQGSIEYREASGNGTLSSPYIPQFNVSNTVSVTGTFWQATQPVSLVSLPARPAYLSSVTVTRPANTTAYDVNDVYGGVFELQNIGPASGFITINSIDIIFNFSSIPSGMNNFTLYLYTSTPPSAYTDNALFSLPSSDRPNITLLKGFNLSSSLAQGGGTVIAELTNINQLIKLGNGITSLWGYLVTNSAFTPASSSESFTIRVRAYGS